MSASTDDNNDRRLENLEAKAAYQERTIEQLNEVVIRQQEQIDRLMEDIRRLQLASNPAGIPMNSDDEPPPPHY